MATLPSSTSTRALCRFHLPGAGARVGAVIGDAVIDLTAREPQLCGSLATLLAASAGTCSGVVDRHAAAQPDHSYAALDRAPASDRPHLLAPIDAQEVWAAGVTYKRSQQARMAESEASADVYARVYEAERPEIFLKATPSRVAGPHAPVVVRADSRWTVPEPELTLLLDSRLEIVGYTVGNDLTARDIEGQNPLYLPQAKIYEGCASIGPLVVLAQDLDPYNLEIRCAIRRQGQELFAATTGTSALHRRLDDLVSYMGRHNRFPAGAYLMTGTGIVPPDSVALQSGDVIEITIGGIGTLRNTVSQ